MTPQIHQGSPYLCGGHKYIAMESGSGTVRVARYDEDLLYPLHKAEWVHASQLKPLPVRRFGGEVR